MLSLYVFLSLCSVCHWQIIKTSAALIAVADHGISSCSHPLLLVAPLFLQSLTVENLAGVWGASEDFCAPQLAKRCVLFALEHCTHIINADSAGANVFTSYMPQMVPALRSSLVEDLNKVAEVGAAVPAPAAGAAV